MIGCSEGNVLEELLQLLEAAIEENIFRGQSQDLGFGNVYGGQVLGQALFGCLPDCAIGKAGSQSACLFSEARQRREAYRL